MGPLSTLSFRAVRGTYFVSYEKGPSSWVPALSTTIVAEDPVTEFRNLEGAPPMEAWQGERKRKTLKDWGIKVPLKKYSSTLEFDVDDVRRDKTGQIARRITELGMKASELPERLLTTKIEANTNGYDGTTFFAASHLHGGTCKNLLTKAGATTPDAPSAAFFASAVLDMLTELCSTTDDQGDPMNAGARKIGLMVPTKYIGVAWTAVRDQFLAAGQSNPLKSTDWQINVYMNPRLNGTAAAAGRRIYCFREDAAVKALLWLEEDIGDQAFQVHGGENTDVGFWREGMAVGPKRIAGHEYGRFEFINRLEIQA